MGSKPADRQAAFWRRLHARAGVALLDPRLLGHVLEAHARLVGERMPERERQVHRVLDERVQLDPAVEAFALLLGEAVELEHDGHLQLGGAQHLEGVLGLGVGEGELDVGMALAEARQRGGSSEALGGGERGEPHAPAAHARDRFELGLRGGQAASTTPAWSTSARPASVRRMPRLVRSTSVAPAVFSSAAICWEMAGCV